MSLQALAMTDMEKLDFKPVQFKVDWFRVCMTEV